LAWCSALLERQIAQVSKFVSLKWQIEKALLDGDQKECFRLLDCIEQNCGLSYWFIATKIALLQIFHGIEAQKQYIVEIKSSGARHNTYFLAYWWGVRAENDTSFDKYTLRLGRQMERASLTPEVNAYIGYLLVGVMPPMGLEQTLLARSNYSSIVDLYQIFSDLFVTAAAEDRPAATLIAEMAARLDLGEIDPRIGKALLVTGKPTGSQASVATLSIRNTRLSSRSPISLPTLRPNGLEELAAAAELTNALVAPEEPFPGIIFALLRQLNERNAAGSKAADDLTRMGAMLDKLSVGGWCVARALQARKPDSISIDSLAKIRLLNTPDLEPMLLANIPARERENFDREVQRVHGDCPTVLAARLASGAITYEDALAAGLDELFASETELIRLARQSKFENALSISTKLNGNLETASKITLQAHIVSLIRLDRIEDALRTAVDWLVRDPTLTLWLPLGEIASAIEQSKRPFDSMIEKPILYDALAKYAGGEFNSLRAYATEDFVNRKGTEKPSQLSTSNLDVAKQKLIYFFAEVCTAPVLRLSIAYQTERELDEELIAICRVLTDLDPDNLEKYEDRARELVRARSIKDALKELQRSKISIDEDALRSVIQKNLSEDFNRYIALLRAGVAVVDENYRKNLLKAISSGEIPQSLFDVPENEASALFASIVVSILAELAFNPEHGLDCYLSLRIRHGTLSGQLRGPAEREHIITRRDAATKEYQANQYWGQRLGPFLQAEYLVEIQKELTAFSRDYDNLIFEFTDQKVQVLSKEKPSGLFRLQISEVTVNSLASEISADKTFGDLIDACIDSFWALVDQSLIKINQYIDRELRSAIRDRFDNLDAALQRIPGIHTATLSDAIRRARTETGARLEAMRDWFVLPTANSSLPFEMQELVDIALTTIKGFRPEFNPSVSLTAPDLPPLSGALHLFSDIFFILFENISLYSGDSIAPSIEIEANVQTDMILVRVTNNVAEDQDIDRIAHSVDRARKRIESGAYLNAVRSEGGTGLPKLAKLIRRDGQQPHLKFGLSDDKHTFSVEFGVSATVIQGNDKEGAE
jgi:hypothetical protein